MSLDEWSDLFWHNYTSISVAAYDVGCVPAALYVLCGLFMLYFHRATFVASNTDVRYVRELTSFLHLWFLESYVSQVLSGALLLGSRTQNAIIFGLALTALAFVGNFDDYTARGIDKWCALVTLVEVATAGIFIAVRAGEMWEDGIQLSYSYVGRFDLLSPTLICMLGLCNARARKSEEQHWFQQYWWPGAVFAVVTVAVFVPLGPLALSNPKTSVTPLPKVAGPAQLWFGTAISAGWTAVLVYLATVVGRIMTVWTEIVPIRLYIPNVWWRVLFVACTSVLAATVESVVFPFVLDSALRVAYYGCYRPLKDTRSVSPAVAAIVAVCVGLYGVFTAVYTLI